MMFPSVLHNFLQKNIICYHYLHLFFKGSCVTQGGGGQKLYKKKIEISVYSYKEMPW